MSDLAFILTIAAIGVGWWIYFDRMKRRWRDRHPDSRDNPIDDWLTGGHDEDDEDDEDDDRRI